MNLYGRIKVNLSFEHKNDEQNFAEIINRVIRPPRHVDNDDIYVRAIYLVSDQVNSFGGRFPADELENLSHLIIDSPVLIGHRKDHLPIARNFKTEIVEDDNCRWIKVWFYWMKSAQGSHELLENIDGGIFKEGSIGFIFKLPECSICHNDIRECNHAPMKKYETGGHHQICHYNYRQIEKVLETSLVFRGATPNTRTTNELASTERNSESILDDEGFILQDDIYSLRLIDTAGLLHLKSNGTDMAIIFPQFNIRALDENRALVGYPLTGIDSDIRQSIEKINGGSIDSGKILLHRKSAGSQLFKLRGKFLNGIYSLKPAFWDKHKLILLSRNDQN